MKSWLDKVNLKELDKRVSNHASENLIFEPAVGFMFEDNEFILLIGHGREEYRVYILGATGIGTRNFYSRLQIDDYVKDAVASLNSVISCANEQFPAWANYLNEVNMGVTIKGISYAKMLLAHLKAKKDYLTRQIEELTYKLNNSQPMPTIKIFYTESRSKSLKDIKKVEQMIDELENGNQTLFNLD